MDSGLIGVIVQSVTMLTVLAAVWQVFLRTKMMHRDIEITFVQRYWQIMDRRSPKFVITGKPSAADEIVVLQYIQLCEDEIALRRAGTVTRMTWLFWEDAIRHQMSVPSYARVLAAVELRQYQGVRELLAAESGFDPKMTSRR